jgi:hypothetical protein
MIFQAAEEPERNSGKTRLSNFLGFTGIACNLPWLVLMFGSPIDQPVNALKLCIALLGVGFVLSICSACKGVAKWGFAAILPAISFVVGVWYSFAASPKMSF